MKIIRESAEVDVISELENRCALLLKTVSTKRRIKSEVEVVEQIQYLGDVLIAGYVNRLLSWSEIDERDVVSNISESFFDLFNISQLKQILADEDLFGYLCAIELSRCILLRISLKSEELRDLP